MDAAKGGFSHGFLAGGHLQETIGATGNESESVP